ncbi:hypothetical protein AB0C84_45395 [Actinomadura sp. NPDC048955]|uniref:hypothetical protein n=1 Tax=Actinomadura sp. NPDC048955 TaxID=3158228 RepID=UPI0033DF1E99
MASPQGTALCLVSSSVGVEPNGWSPNGRRTQVMARQITAAVALYDLITRDLPGASWNISEFIPALNIQLHSAADDEMRAGIAEWAAFFRTQPRVEPLDDHVAYVVEATHAGAPVKVWCHTNRP